MLAPGKYVLRSSEIDSRKGAEDEGSCLQNVSRNKPSIMKAKIIQSGFYNGNERKLVAICKERDTLTFDHVCKASDAGDEKLVFKVQRGMPWFDKHPLSVYLRFEDYIAID